MDATRAALLRASWSSIEANGTELAQAFYTRLFELHPALEDLFVLTEMESQEVKFLTMLSEVVRLADKPESLEALLVESGKRHRGYGVVGHHYMTVGEALLWALDHALPDGLDDDTRGAWAEAYTRMAFIMQRP